MTASQVLRPIGFRPEEISAMVNEMVVEQHAEEAAFLWGQRDRAVTAPNFRLKDLARLDERVEAHLDGLRVAGQFGWKLCEQALAEPGPGEVFAAAVLAFGAGDQERIATVLRAASSNPKLQRGVVSALGWLPFAETERLLPMLTSSDQPVARRIAIAGCAVQRRDPGQQLLQALSDSDLKVRARALNACGELGKSSALRTILQSVSSSDAPCRFFSAWSAARLGDRSAPVLGTLREFAVSTGQYSQCALDMALRITSMDAANEWYRQLRADPAKSRIAATAAGIIGDPALINDLLQLMKVPAAARRAGAAFAMITGVDLAYADLDAEPPADFEGQPTETPEGDIVMDPDLNLRWPAPDLVAAWWMKNAAGFTSGKRYLLGNEITEAVCLDMLAKGYQPQRIAAALELGLRQPSRPLFEIRARANQQTKALQSWNS
jgi:uncharacterized protein (TIGR02270 family)